MVYVGSKAKLAKFIVPIIQKYINANYIDTYIEPFVGGANIIDKINCKNKFGFDLHKGLIEIYKAVQNGWTPPLSITEEDYRLARQNKLEEPLKSYIGFNGSYGSKYFGGYARGLKSDGITHRDIYNERTRNFLKQIPNLKNIIFEQGNYITIKTEGALIYCDPPYQNTTKYSVGQFNSDIFWNWVRQLSKSNIVIVSEFLYPKDFKAIWSRERFTSLDKNTGGTKSTESLIIIKEQ